MGPKISKPLVISVGILKSNLWTLVESRKYPWRNFNKMLAVVFNKPLAFFSIFALLDQFHYLVSTYIYTPKLHTTCEVVNFVMNGNFFDVFQSHFPWQLSRISARCCTNPYTSYLSTSVRVHYSNPDFPSHDFIPFKTPCFSSEVILRARWKQLMNLPGLNLPHFSPYPIQA